jgi:hypothetical protein
MTEMSAKLNGRLPLRAWVQSWRAAEQRSMKRSMRNKSGAVFSGAIGSDVTGSASFCEAGSCV